MLLILERAMRPDSCHSAALLSSILLVLLLAACDSSSEIRGAGDKTPPPAPVVVTTSLPRGTRGTPYAAQLIATAPVELGAISWSLAAQSAPMPGGIVLQADGSLNGTPAASGLFVLTFRCTPAAGSATEATLDIVIYEPTGYTHAPDMYDVPANDSFATATNLGALSQAAPIVQQTPLSVSSNPADPIPDPRDYFSFTTPCTGRIQIEVYFDSAVGKLLTSLGGEHNGVPESIVNGVAIANSDDGIMVLDSAPAGTWYLKVEAQLKNSTWNANGYTFRISFNDLTITTALIEHDLAAASAMSGSFEAALAGMPVTSGSWSVVSGALPSGVTLGSNGALGGTTTHTGLFDATVSVAFDGGTTSRAVRIRVYDTDVGNYWRRFGNHRYYDPARTNGDGEYHEHYCEATVVAPHPAYGGEGAIYVIGGRVAATVSTVYVFHTNHQANADLEYKLEDIARPLANERQYLGAAYLQHTYGGYIYVVGGELYSNTAPSSGNFTRTVERMQVADGSGVALATPGYWEAVAELPSDLAGRVIQGWAEMALVANDAGVDADDRLYLLAGRIQVESSPGSGTYGKEENDAVLMFEPPNSAAGLGTWYRKADVAPYTPRRFPAAGMINGRIYLAGGTGAAGTLDTIEMYEPEPAGANAAISTLGAGNYPALAEPVFYAAAAVDNGRLYILNGWKFQAYSPVATCRLQVFEPNGGGTGGTMNQLAAPDNASGYHSATFHDGELWFITGRDSLVQTPHYSLRYTPAP
jgi:hypothetical protein